MFWGKCSWYSQSINVTNTRVFFLFCWKSKLLIMIIQVFCLKFKFQIWTTIWLIVVNVLRFFGLLSFFFALKTCMSYKKYHVFYALCVLYGLSVFSTTSKCLQLNLFQWFLPYNDINSSHTQTFTLFKFVWFFSVFFFFLVHIIVTFVISFCSLFRIGFESKQTLFTTGYKSISCVTSHIGHEHNRWWKVDGSSLGHYWRCRSFNCKCIWTFIACHNGYHIHRRWIGCFL